MCVLGHRGLDGGPGPTGLSGVCVSGAPGPQGIQGPKGVIGFIGMVPCVNSQSGAHGFNFLRNLHVLPVCQESEDPRV